MASDKKKGRCVRCGKKMKLADRYCMRCGVGNPLLVASRRRAPAVKSAGQSYAPVADLGAARRAQLWREIHGEADPNRREDLFGMLYKQLGGDAA